MSAESLATDLAMLRAENSNLRARLATAMRCAAAVENGDMIEARIAAGELLALQKLRPMLGIEHEQRPFDRTGAPG